MPSKKKANNDESRAEDLPALDSVTEDAPAAHSSRSTATAIAPANVRDDKESDDKEVAEIEQLLVTETDYSELVRLRQKLRVTNNRERLSDDLICSLLKKFQVSEKGQQKKKTRLKRLKHIVDPPHDDLKQMDAVELSGKKISYEQLVSYFFETHGYLPVMKTTKKDLAKEIIAARSGGLNFYLDLSYNQIKDILVNKYGRRYHNDTVQRKTLVEHLRAEEESHENKPDDWIREEASQIQPEALWRRENPDPGACPSGRTKTELQNESSQFRTSSSYEETASDINYNYNQNYSCNEESAYSVDLSQQQLMPHSHDDSLQKKPPARSKRPPVWTKNNPLPLQWDQPSRNQRNALNTTSSQYGTSSSYEETASRIDYNQNYSCNEESAYSVDLSQQQLKPHSHDDSLQKMPRARSKRSVRTKARKKNPLPLQRDQQNRNRMRLDSSLGSEEQREKENISSHSNHQQQQLAPQDLEDKMRQLQDEIQRAESTTKECRQAFDRAIDDVNIALENRNIVVQNLQKAKEECERSERAYHEKGVVLRDENTKLHNLKKQMEQYKHLIKMKSDPAVTNDYDIIGILGSGGFGHVLECRRKEDKKIFAMKSLPIEDSNIFAEMGALKKLRHPNIVHFETFLADGKKMCHLILDYAIGGNVQTLIETRQSLRLSEELCAFLSADLANGLKYMFDEGYCHCDLKPANLLLTGSLPTHFLRNNPDNLSRVRNPDDLSFENSQIGTGNFRLQIGDFGLATWKISHNRVCGTKHFMAPEVKKTNGDEYNCKKADVFSAGRVIYAMRFGLPPQPQPNLAAARAECSRELMRVFDTALADDPNDRDIEQFWEAIKNWSESLRVSS